jgi:hypothetical protein
VKVTRTRSRVAVVVIAVASLATLAASQAGPGRAAPAHPIEDTLAARVSEGRMRQAVKDLVALGPRLGGSPSGERAVEYARTALEGTGLAVAVVADTPRHVPAEPEVLKGDGTPRTVLGTLRGSRSAYYLVSAHGDSDSGGPGADDNASGVAVVLEVARVLGEAARRGEVSLASSVRFAVWGTEYWSSNAYVEREGRTLADCLAVLNVDQAGTGAEREAVYFEGNDVPWNADLLRTFDQIGRDYLGRPGFWPEAVTTPTQGGTDAYAFLPSKFQGEDLTAFEIPATTIFTSAWGQEKRLRQSQGWDGNDDGSVVVDYSRHYHRPTDTPENTTELEPQNMVRVARAITIALLRLGAARH